MEAYHITGGVRLSGEVALSGAKNAILPILAATVAIDDISIIHGCPDLSDVRSMLEILEELGCKTTFEQDVITVDARTIDSMLIPEKLTREMRSSVFLMGPMLARCGKVTLSYPGGCEIGLRPIDIHLKALRSLGVEINDSHGYLECAAIQMKGANIQLDFPSVGATENAIMAAIGAEGETRILNVAKEPEILNLQRFLNKSGAEVKGAGTGQIIVKGGKKLRGGEHTVISDRIEAGTLLTAAAITGGEVTLKNANPAHLGLVLSKLRETGCRIQEEKDTIHLTAPLKLAHIENITTLPYPGFPTDLQSQFLSMLTTARGTSVITENIFENRFKHVDELMRMGAKVKIYDRSAVIIGVEQLSGAKVSAKDLRGGAALVIAGLAASGNTIVENICYIDRGYDKFEVTLSRLGAKILRIKEQE